MSSDSFFRTGFFTLFSLLTLMRLYYRAKAGLLRERPPLRAEGNLVLATRVLFGVPLIAATICYGLHPQGTWWMEVQLPWSVRMTGLVLGFAALISLWAVHHALGDNFTTSVLPKAHQTLVQTGPYRWVRHPMYSSYLALFVAAFLVSENVVIGFTGTAIILSLMTLRLRKEEALLIERFGDRYRRYMKTTRRFFPSLNPRWYARRAVFIREAGVPLGELHPQEASLAVHGNTLSDDV